MRWWLRSAGSVARALVVLLTIGTAFPLASHPQAGHDPCDQPLIAGPAGGPVLKAASSTTLPQHCEFCHWLRSMRVFVAASATAICGLELRQPADAAPPAAAVPIVFRHIAARGPPA
jgi:hypothetical protein